MRPFIHFYEVAHTIVSCFQLVYDGTFQILFKKYTNKQPYIRIIGSRKNEVVWFVMRHQMEAS